MSWILTNRKTGKSRSFKSLETGRAAAMKASDKYGVRYISLRSVRRAAQIQVKPAAYDRPGQMEPLLKQS